MALTQTGEKSDFLKKMFSGGQTKKAPGEEGSSDGGITPDEEDDTLPLSQNKNVLKNYLSETRWLVSTLKMYPHLVREILLVLSVTKENSRLLGFVPVYKLYRALEDLYKGIEDKKTSITDNIRVLVSAVAGKISACCDLIENGDLEELAELDVKLYLLYLDKAVTGEIFDAEHLAPKKALSAPENSFSESEAGQEEVKDMPVQVLSSKIDSLVNQHEEMIARTYIIMNQVELLRNAIGDGDMKAARESNKQISADSQNLLNALLLSHDQLMSFVQDDSFLARHQDFHGFFVFANGRKYLIPAEFVIDVISESPLNYVKKQNQKFFIYVQENESGDEKSREEIPVYSLSSLLPGNPTNEKSIVDTIMLVDYQSQRIGIIVDSMHKFVSLIKKPMPSAFEHLSVLKGLAFDEKYDMIPILHIPEIMKKFRAFRGYDVKKFEAFSKKRVKRVLIIDDSDTTRLIEHTILEGNGFSVEEALDGIEAISRVKERRFDLIICDDQMPRMNGEIFLDNLRRMENAKNIPVIAISEKTIPKADAFMSKSDFKRDVLIEKIKELFNE